MAKVKIEGLRELEAALSQLPKATGKNVLRRVLKARAEPMARMAASIAPDDPGTSGARDLASSIAVSTKLSPRQRRQHRKMFRNDKASVEMFVGAGPLPHPHLQEFGTSKMGAQPFMRPSWDASKGPMLEGLKDDLWSEIAKAAARLAKKAAKLNA